MPAMSRSSKTWAAMPERRGARFRVAPFAGAAALLYVKEPADKEVLADNDADVVFLHRVEEGPADRSYGIQVARLAGVPQPLIDRAKEILHDIERDADDLAPRIAHASGDPDGSGMQRGLFDPEPRALERALEAIDVDQTTPLEALRKLKEMKELFEH